MNRAKKAPFNAVEFLTTAGTGRRIVRLKAKEHLFSQGGAADSVFYIQSGRAKLTVVSRRGKEATITLLTSGDFAGEEALSAVGGLRVSSATAIVSCVVLEIGREQMLHVLHDERLFSSFFLKFMLLRGIRTQADLVDQLFNSSERRLARMLLLMANFGKPGEPQTVIPRVSQETLAELIGTTRSRVSFFMNRFRKLGYLQYNGRIHVHRSLLNVVLHDSLPEQRAQRPRIDLQAARLGVQD